MSSPRRAARREVPKLGPPAPPRKRMSKEERRIYEMTVLPAEAIAEAVQKFRKSGAWPRKRFRVEGSAAGNSMLLSKIEARRTQSRYGGEIVELLPEMPSLDRLHQDAAAGLPPCPKCHAAADHPCVKAGGRRSTYQKPTLPHRARVREAKKADEP